MGYKASDRLEKCIVCGFRLRLSRRTKSSVYFVKLVSSLYDGTAESNFAKSKQSQGKLDVFLVVKLKFIRFVEDAKS